MINQTPLIFACDIQGNKVTELAWTDIQANPKPIKGTRRWMHFDRTADEAKTWLEQSGCIPVFLCNVLFQEETRPRAFTHERAILLNLRGVNLNDGQEPEDLISLRIYADEQLLLTTRAQKLLAAEDLKTLIDQGKPPPTNASMVTFLANRLTERLEPVTQGLEEQVDALEADMLDQNTPPPKLAVAEFRRNVLSLRRYIYPQREAISSLLREANDLLSDKDRLILRETQDIIFRLSEQLDMLRERAVVLQEQIVELRAEAMNQRLFVLAIISAIFLPLSFVTGLFGVNVGGMPGVESPAAFAVLCFTMLALVAGLFYLFKKLKWI